MQRFAAALLLLVLAFRTAAAEPIAVVPRTDPNVAQMEDTYRRYLKASKAGDKAALQQTMSERARTALDRVRPELIAQMTRDDLDPADSHFARGDLRQLAGRIVYWKDFGDTIRWQGIVFVKEKEGWRIDRVVTALDPKTLSADTRLKVGPLGLENLLADPNMQLPAR